MTEKPVTHRRKPVSYLRNRDYSKQFIWTQVLNEDVYNCHIKAKLDPKIGYMNRLKLYWDELHTEFIHLASKNLRDQADTVKKRKINMETEENISLQQNIDNDIEINNNTNDNHQISEQKNEHQHAIIDHNTPEEDRIKETPKDDLIKEKLNMIFKRNYQNYVIKEIEQRTIPTKLNKKIDKDIIKVANEIIENHLYSSETISTWEINCTIYCIAISCKEINNDLPTGEIQNKK